MTTPTPTATAQTLPPSWTPTAPGCLRSTDFWVWMYNTDLASSDARTVLGGPSQTTDCLAPTWTSDAAYAGTQCPPNYTPACSADAVTCCPTLVLPSPEEKTNQMEPECRTKDRLTDLSPDGGYYHLSVSTISHAWPTSSRRGTRRCSAASRSGAAKAGRPP